MGLFVDCTLDLRVLFPFTNKARILSMRDIPVLQLVPCSRTMSNIPCGKNIYKLQVLFCPNSILCWAQLIILLGPLRMHPSSFDLTRNRFDHFNDNFQARQCNGYNLPCNIQNTSWCVSQTQANEVYRVHSLPPSR